MDNDLDLLGDLPEKRIPDGERVTVLVTMKHLRNYGRDPVSRLTYGCSFPVSIGEVVWVPPSPQNQVWIKGTVVALESDGYDGPVKSIRQIK